MARLPPLVLTGNRIDVLGPMNLYGTVLHNFCVEADQAKIQAWLDKTFSIPSAGAVRYEAVGSKVFVSIAQIKRIVALDELEKDHGFSSEIDLTIWVIARRVDDGLLAMRFIPAYLFVDNGPAMASGREVWGFPKQLGQFDFSPQGPDGGGPHSFRANAYVIDPYLPSTAARWAPMLAIEPVPKPGSAPRGAMLRTLEALAQTVIERVDESFSGMVAKLQSTLGAGTVCMAFLKQFPDAANPMTACYQGIIEANARVLKLRGAGLTEDHYRLRLDSFASLPFFDELGIASGWQDVGRGIWVDYDFTLDLGSEVWRA